MQAEIGDGSHTLFWKDRWLHGQRLVDIASRLVAAIPKRRINQQTVQEALFENRWALDIQGTITVGVLHEYLKLWEELQAVELQLGVQDIHFWRFAENRQYSAKSAYEGLFWGSVQFEPYERIWKAWVPPKCRYFAWLVALQKCWTADRPEKCPLSDQMEETMNHLLVTCVFSRQFWFNLLRQVQLQDLTPQPDSNSFMEWWGNLNNQVTGPTKKGLNSIINHHPWCLDNLEA
jgi:hypothetical protein